MSEVTWSVLKESSRSAAYLSMLLRNREMTSQEIVEEIREETKDYSHEMMLNLIGTLAHMASLAEPKLIQRTMIAIESIKEE